jgi:hypothetical protein
MGKNARTMKPGVFFIVCNQNHYTIIVDVEMTESGIFIPPERIDIPNFPAFKRSIQIIKMLNIMMRMFMYFNDFISMAIA